MGKVAGAQNFDGANWYEQHIAKRTRDALAEQDRAFAEKHAGDSLDQLAAYLRPLRRTLGSPCPHRDRRWQLHRRALWRLERCTESRPFDPIYKKPRNRDCGRYQNEKNIQIRCIGASVTLNGQHGLSESSNAKANALFTKPQRKPSLQQM